MKLIATKGRLSNMMVTGDWHVGDPELTWFSVWWEPTEEDYIERAGMKTKAYRGGEHGFPVLSSSFIPEGSLVYAEFSAMLGESSAMLQELQERGFHQEIPTWGRRDPGLRPGQEKRHWWKRPHRTLIDEAVYAEVDRDFVANYFKTYGSWQSDICTFLVTRKPVPDWVQHLDQTSRKDYVTRELLTNIDLVLRNRWEHGFEVLSMKHSYEGLLEMAKKACEKLEWQLEIRTTHDLRLCKICGKEILDTESWHPKRSWIALRREPVHDKCEPTSSEGSS